MLINSMNDTENSFPPILDENIILENFTNQLISVEDDSFSNFLKFEDSSFDVNNTNESATTTTIVAVAQEYKWVNNLTLLPLLSNQPLTNEEYEGPFKFEVAIVPNFSSPWVYSAKLNKVFIDMNTEFPVDFKLTKRPTNLPLYVRLIPQYCSHNYSKEPVCRCIQHVFAADPSNKDIEEHVREHVVRCSNERCQYVGNTKESERLTPIFPLYEPQIGSDSVRELFRFVCMSSCPLPGMGRRELEIIFTLEDEHANIYGRKSLKVKICACPKRDMEKEEEKRNKEGSKVARGKRKKIETATSSNNSCNTTIVINSASAVDDSTIRPLSINLIGTKMYLKVLDFIQVNYKAKIFDVQGLGQPEEAQYKQVVEDAQNEIRKVQSGAILQSHHP